MSHHFVQQLIHVVWSTKQQSFKIPPPLDKNLYAYLSKVIASKGGKLYFAHGHLDHVHSLLSLPPYMSISKMMSHIKQNSSRWIKYQNLIDPNFSWEDGYTAFSIQDDRVDAVCTYMKTEEQRHKTASYAEEISKLLDLHDIKYDEKYCLTSSHSKILVHAIWATKNRFPFINKSIVCDLYNEIRSTITSNGCITHAIGGIEDHIHLLIEVSRTTALSDLINEIKVSSRHLFSSKSPTNDFQWQTGYGAFTISLPFMNAVKLYISQQEEHHKNGRLTTSQEWNQFILKKGLTNY